MNRLGTKGFAVIETILVLIVIMLVSATGYFIYSSNKKTNDELNRATAASQSTAPFKRKVAKKPLDPTAGWLAYHNASASYGLKYPRNWVTATHPELCGDGMFLVGPDADSVGKCGSDAAGQIAFSSIDGEQVGALSSENWRDTTKSDVTVDGVKGRRVSATLASETQGIGFAAGTKEVVYAFSAKGRTFTARYDQEPTGPLSNNVLAEFDLIVTKTLKFE